MLIRIRGWLLHRASLSWFAALSNISLRLRPYNIIAASDWSFWQCITFAIISILRCVWRAKGDFDEQLVRLSRDSNSAMTMDVADMRRLICEEIPYISMVSRRTRKTQSVKWIALGPEDRSGIHEIGIWEIYEPLSGIQLARLFN